MAHLRASASSCLMKTLSTTAAARKTKNIRNGKYTAATQPEKRSVISTRKKSLCADISVPACASSSWKMEFVSTVPVPCLDRISGLLKAQAVKPRCSSTV